MVEGAFGKGEPPVFKKTVVGEAAPTGIPSMPHVDMNGEPEDPQDAEIQQQQEEALRQRIARRIASSRREPAMQGASAGGAGDGDPPRGDPEPESDLAAGGEQAAAAEVTDIGARVRKLYGRLYHTPGSEVSSGEKQYVRSRGRERTAEEQAASDAELAKVRAKIEAVKPLVDAQIDKGLAQKAAAGVKERSSGT